ncbi:hypothetical protein WT37_26490 [Burkholderia territorii]|nr:hypothetical protein WT37_26490 [Burkholderia territorii]
MSVALHWVMTDVSQAMEYSRIRGVIGAGLGCHGALPRREPRADNQLDRTSKQEGSYPSNQGTFLAL